MRPLGFLAFVLLATGIAAASAESRTKSDVTLAKQRFESSAAGIKRLLSASKLLDEEERNRLPLVQFSFEPSPLPVLRHDRRFGELRVVISDGWIALAEDLLRAAALSRPECFQSFASNVLAAARANRRAANAGSKQRLRAVPRLADHVKDTERERGSGCAGIGNRQLRLPSVDNAVTTGLDALLFWSIARELHPLLTSNSANPANHECIEIAADRSASEWALRAEIDLAAGAAAVLLHVALAEPADCAAGSQRLEAFLREWVPADRQTPLRAALGD